MLRVRGLVAGYGPLSVLRGVDLDAASGQLVAVVGANGAGKTTLLRAISGLIAPSAGEVSVDGVDVAGLPAERVARHRVAHVPENRLLFPTLSVLDNLELGAWAARRSRSTAETDETRGVVLDLFPKLKTRLRQAAGTLSGGEQQMVAIGRGIMAGPQVLLLDEPSTGLAPLVVAEIMAAMSTLRDVHGMSIVLVEQNVSAAFGTADHGVVLDRGEVVLGGAARDLLADPRVRHAYLGGAF